jgi:hypothetical protein
MHFDHPDYQKLAMSWRIAGDDDRRGYTLTMEHRSTRSALDRGGSSPFTGG